MKFAILSTVQLILLSLMMSVVTAVLVSINSFYQNYVLLPKVVVDHSGACVKVVNYQNGHAFNCADVNVLLRIYRTVGENST